MYLIRFYIVPFGWLQCVVYLQVCTTYLIQTYSILKTIVQPIGWKIASLTLVFSCALLLTLSRSNWLRTEKFCVVLHETQIWHGKTIVNYKLEAKVKCYDGVLEATVLPSGTWCNKTLTSVLYCFPVLFCIQMLTIFCFECSIHLLT